MTGSLRLPGRLGPLLLFGVLGMGLVAAEHYVVHRPEFAWRPALGTGVAFDLLVVLPGLFYWLVGWRGGSRQLVATRCCGCWRMGRPCAVGPCWCCA